jgi:hypothetical protein
LPFVFEFRHDAAPDPAVRAEYEALVAQWGVTPYLQTLLTDAGR